MTRRGLEVLTVSCLVAGTLFAKGDDMPGFDFLRWDLGARASAMGGAYTTASGDLHGLLYNPAALYTGDANSAVFCYHRYYLDMQSGFTAFSRKTARGLIAGAVAYMDYGQMTRTTVSREELGTFSPGDLVLTAAWADSLPFGLAVGAAVKYIHQSYDQYRASALAVDIGCVYTVPDQNLRLGISVRNAGTALSSFTGRKAALPFSLRAGISKRLAHLPLLLQLDLIHLDDSARGRGRSLYWALGGEFTITETLYLRWGYHSRGSEQSGGEGGVHLAGISAGIGIAYPAWRLDCGWNFYGVLGNVASVSVTLPL
ncbi:PorV/PorQ family protein [bacterium]|nr:PorV/PorQ family protein [bacterium]